MCKNGTDWAISKINLKKVFKYLIGPLPWSFANAYGPLRKTNKAKLMQLLEKGTAAVERYLENASVSMME